MPIDPRRLRSAAAGRDLKIEGGDAMLAECASEGCPAIHQFSRVIFHIFNDSPSNCLFYGQ
jgi:hypothetical protein